MSVLSEINTIAEAVGVPSETGYFSGTPPDEYIVITPMSDTFELFADNQPQNEIQEARLSLYSKKNYSAIKNRLVRKLLQAGFTVTDRRYIGLENDTHYHHYAIDVAKDFLFEEEEI